MQSIRQQITSQVFLAILISSFLVSAILFHLTNGYFNTEFNQTLLQKARTLITLTSQSGGQVELNFAGEFMPEFEQLSNGEYFQLWFADETLIERSDSLFSDMRKEDLPFANGALDRPLFQDVIFADGRQGRAVTIEFVPQAFEGGGFDASGPEDDIADLLERQNEIRDEEELDPSSQVRTVITVAKSTQLLTDSVLVVLLTLVLIFSIFSGIVFFLCRTLIVRGLLPLQAISKKIKSLNLKALETSDPILTDTLELQPIARQFNGLIDRVRAEFESQARFTGDVAHELRTPIAELKMLSEVAEKWPDDHETNKQFFIDAKDIANNMERTVVDLLELVRADSGNFQVIHDSVELVTLIEAVLELNSSTAEARGVRLCFEHDGLVSVTIDLAKCRRLINNLIVNAIDYCTSNTVINIELKHREEPTTITISNQTDALEEADLEVMFKRFWRKDKSRTGEGNSGLGLSIVTELAKQMELRIQCSLSKNCFSVKLDRF